MPAAVWNETEATFTAKDSTDFQGSLNGRHVHGNYGNFFFYLHNFLVQNK